MDITMWKTMENADSIESRGPMNITGWFSTELDAYAHIKLNHKPDMGGQLGEIWKVHWYDDPQEYKLICDVSLVWGGYKHKNDWTDRDWDRNSYDGIVAQRDKYRNPEYAEYKRLKAIFET